MKIKNISRPGKKPKDGDTIMVEHDNGAKEKKVFHKKMEAEKIPFVYNDVLGFYDALGTAAMVAIIELSKSEPIVELLMMRAKGAAFIDCADPRTVAGLQLIASKLPEHFPDGKLEAVIDGSALAAAMEGK